MIETRLSSSAQTIAVIACPQERIPAAGQYLQAHDPVDKEAALPLSIFPASPPLKSREGNAQFITASPVPDTWQPGNKLILRGPLGRGFELPDRAKRVALIAMATNAERLLPLAFQAVEKGSEAALFCDRAPLDAPARVEINPLEDATDAFAWADYAAIDVQKKDLAAVRAFLGLGQMPGIPAQALVQTQMPCGGLAGCGICWVKAAKGYKLACSDGPVFDLAEIDLSG